MSRRLTRHIDPDLVERILLYGPIKKPPKQAKRARLARPWFTYRAAWSAVHRENHSFDIAARRLA